MAADMLAAQFIEHVINVVRARPDAREQHRVFFGVVQPLGEFVDVINDGPQELVVGRELAGRHVGGDMLQRMDDGGECAVFAADDGQRLLLGGHGGFSQNLVSGNA